MNILITGAGRGIGFEAVRRFSDDGANTVLALSRNIASLEALGRKNVRPLSFDLALGGGYDGLAGWAAGQVEGLDVLVHNAGSMLRKEFGEMTADDIDRVYAVNVRGVMLLTGRLLPLLRKGRERHIVTIGSMGGVQGSVKFSGLSAYSSSKAALAVLTECLAEELRDSGIRANCLALGSVQTEMLGEAFPGYRAPVSAAEMAAYVCDFAANGWRYYSGKVLPVSLSTP